jgi:hypothetical protein
MEQYFIYIPLYILLFFSFSNLFFYYEIQSDIIRTSRAQSFRTIKCIMLTASIFNTCLWFHEQSRTFQLTYMELIPLSFPYLFVHMSSQKQRWWNWGHIFWDFHDFLYHFIDSSMLAFINSKRPLKKRNHTPWGYSWKHSKETINLITHLPLNSRAVK